MANVKSDTDALAYLKKTRDRLRWLFKIRPNTLASPLYRLFSPYDRRTVVDVGDIQFSCDPLSYTAGEIIEHGTYESETLEMLGRYLKPGAVFVDIGANEGFIASAAARIVGETGTVVAIEPQSEIARTLTTNLAINCRGKAFVFQKAMAQEDDQEITIHLAPYVNSGGSSIVRRPFMARKEVVRTISFRKLVELTNVQEIDLIKVDVEGFEKEIVESMLASNAMSLIKNLALDYHAAILADRKVDPRTIETQILETGMKKLESEGEFNGYTVYGR
jgi:FkbM family methyltransferase